jgi:hypothetical protein
MLQKAGIRLVANDRYNRFDTSLTGQAPRERPRLKAAAPDAIVVAGVAAAALRPMQLAGVGYAGWNYHTYGVATDDFILTRGRKADGAVMGGTSARAGPGPRRRAVARPDGRGRQAGAQGQPGTETPGNPSFCLHFLL